MGDGYVYVVGSGRAGDPVKIGWSTRPDGRVKALQTASPFELKVLAMHPGTSKLENFLHHEFADIRMHGEWFNFGSDDPVPLIDKAVQVWHAGGRVIPVADRTPAEVGDDLPSALKLIGGGIGMGREMLRRLVRLSHPQLRVVLFYLITEKNPDFDNAVVLTAEKVAEAIGMNRPLLARTIPGLLERGWLRRAHRRGNVWYYGLGPEVNLRSGGP